MAEQTIKRILLMRNFSYTQINWSKFLQRFESGAVIKRSSEIHFEGTEKQFDELHDMLISDESNSKIIGIYPG